MTTNKTRPKAISSVQIDNERVIVTEWRFPVGAETGWHVHAFYYVVVPQTDGRLTLETDDGQANADLRSGVSYIRNKERYQRE